MQNLLIEGVKFLKTSMCKNSKYEYAKLKKLLINDKKCPISSVFSQIMRIFASEYNQVIAKNCKNTALNYE